MDETAEQESLSSRRSNDFIVDLFKQGFHHVLEKIVMEFPLKTIQACKEVSPEWWRIVLHFHNSKASRILKMQNLKIAEEWRNQNYTIQAKEFANAIPGFAVQCHEIIADQRSILMNTYVSGDPAPFHIIVVFDANTLDITNTFTLKEEFLFKNHASIGLKLDDKFLYCYSNQTRSECLIFRRQTDGNGFLTLPPKELTKFYNEDRLGSFIASKSPYVHNGHLHLPISSSITSCKLIMDIWNIKKDTKVTKEITFPTDDYFLLKDGSGRFFSRVDNALYFYSGENGGELKWKKSILDRQPTLLQADKDYAAFTWELQDNTGHENDLVEIYTLKCGTVLITFEAEFGIRCKSLAQFAYHRLGFSTPKLTDNPTGKIYDTIVYDLKTRQKIFSLEEDLGFDDVAYFALERDKLYFVDKHEKLQSLKFWI